MKLKIFTLIIIIVFTTCKRKQIYKTSKKNLIFKTKDSGYLFKKDIQFLNLKFEDTIAFKNTKETDTIGKFYKKDKNYIVCVDGFPNGFTKYFLMEITNNGTILKKEEYGAGFYLSCCGKEKFDGFQKRNDFFIFNTCGTGSAYSSSNLLIFKEITPQEQLNSILTEQFCGLCEIGKKSPLACTLDSKMEFKSDSLIVHYIFKRGFDDIQKIKPKEIRKFDVTYLFKNKNWIALDSTKLDGIPI